MLLKLRMSMKSNGFPVLVNYHVWFVITLLQCDLNKEQVWNDKDLEKWEDRKNCPVGLQPSLPGRKERQGGSGCQLLCAWLSLFLKNTLLTIERLQQHCINASWPFLLGFAIKLRRLHAINVVLYMVLGCTNRNVLKINSTM